MSEHQGAAKHELLAEVAAEVSAEHIGDRLNYVRSYYRHVDASDLIEAGVKRAATVAAQHAALAAHRPQGRALVQVRSGAEDTLLPSRDVIDVVTDDMPFLVDTITMTLARHDVAAELVVHPQLMVRRDVSGALHEVLRPIEGPGDIDKVKGPGTAREPDQIAESWSHIEVSRLAADKAAAIETDLERGLADVRMAVEDYPKMRAMAVQLADQLEAERVRESAADESGAEILEFLRWLVDRHFTFLGYR